MQAPTTDNNSRRADLLSMIQGKRGGYWIEEITAADGTAYQLHTPKDNGRLPLLPCTWAAVLLHAARFLSDVEAMQLPKYNDGRVYKGCAIDTGEMQALLKWTI